MCPYAYQPPSHNYLFSLIYCKCDSNGRNEEVEVEGCCDGWEGDTCEEGKVTFSDTICLHLIVIFVLIELVKF